MKILDPYIQKRYSEYDERVIEFLSRVYEDVKENNEKINNYFYCCMDLLANQLKLYFLGVDAIDADKKVSSTDDYKRVSKNPAIAVMTHAHQQILDILQKFSLSPFDAAKLKRLKNNDGDEDAETLLNSLVE